MKFIFKYLRFLAHLGFWFSYFILVSYTFSAVFRLDVVILRTIIVGLFHIVTVYFHLYFLIPKLFKKRMYLSYAFLLILVVVVSVPIKTFLIFNLFEDFFKQYQGESSIKLYINNILGSGVMLFVTTGLWLAEQGILNLKAREELTRVKLESELEMLRNQINPHFLFNVLNNIYSLAYAHSPKAPEAILKLSEMLRYMLYDSQNDTVEIFDEIKYLDNFIELQKIKIGDHGNISFVKNIANGSFKLPPLLLIPFFENAVKHGELNRRKKGYIRAKITVEGNILDFRIANPVKNNDAKSHEPGGIGISNVKGRLALFYPKKHLLEIKNDNNEFEIHLKIW